MAKCITKIAKRNGWDPIVEADVMGGQCLADYNERVERLGREDGAARKLYQRGQFWLDRYNKLAGNS